MPEGSIKLDLAQRAQASGDLENARLLYKEILTVNPENTTAIGWLGIVEAQQKNYLLAEDHLLKALSKEENNIDFLQCYAFLLMEKKHNSDAIRFFQKIIRQRPIDSDVFINLAICYSETNNLDLAIKNFDIAIQLKPDVSEAWFYRGNTLNNLKCYDEALESYNRALAEEVDYFDAWVNRGVTLYELKRYI